MDEHNHNNAGDEEVESLVENAGSGSRNAKKKKARKNKLKHSISFETFCRAFVLLLVALVFCAVSLYWSYKDNNKEAIGSTTATTTNSAATTTTTTSAPSSNNDHHSAIAATQIENFKQGKKTSLLLNLHITHHGGTTFCAEIGKKLGAPTFACMGPQEVDHVGNDYPKDKPWTHNDTAHKIEIVTQYFKMVSWEFAHKPLSLEGVSNVDGMMYMVYCILLDTTYHTDCSNHSPGSPPAPNSRH